MKKILTIGFALLAFPLGVGLAAATSGGGPPNQGPPHPGCKPSDDTPQKCHTTSTETQPPTTTTVTETTTQTVTVPPITVTTPAVPPPAPVITITQGPTSQTVNITITINGVPETITIPGTVPGTKPACVNTLKTSTLGPLPRRFKSVKRVTVHIDGRNELRSLSSNRTVSVNVAGLACGTYAIVANDFPNTKAVTPVLRIWALTGGNHVQKAGFPLSDPPIGLS